MGTFMYYYFEALFNILKSIVRVGRTKRRFVGKLQALDNQHTMLYRVFLIVALICMFDAQ